MGHSLEHRSVIETNSVRSHIAAVYLSLAEQARSARVVRTDSMWTVESAIDHPVGNLAIRLSVSNEDIRDLARIARSNPNFRVHVLPGDRPFSLGAHLENEGLRQVYELSILTIDERPPAAGVLVRCPDTEVAHLCAFIIDNFLWTSPASLRAEVAAVCARAANERTRFFRVDRGGQTVGAGCLIEASGVTGLYNICVSPGERGQGLGTKIVADLCAFAPEDQPILLLSEQELVPWYRSMGFREIGRSAVYASPRAHRR